MRMFRKSWNGLVVMCHRLNSAEGKKRVEEIAKKYNIEYDDIDDFITTVKGEYNCVQELKK